jgi:hydroxymethylpyrimidine pyrophosphatase-like HAD family hydrolase
MKLRVLALDYDGTIATNGSLHEEVRAAIAEVRSRGIVVLLATGRMLSDLRVLLGDLEIFDAVVAENGAVLALPKVGRTFAFAAAPQETLLELLRMRGMHPRQGSCVVELPATDARVALDSVRVLQLPVSLQFNRDRLMLLPQAISKATGLREALRMLRLSEHNAIAVGDAENDHELLAACELGYAVAWGSPALQAAADGLVIGEGPQAIAGWIRRITATGSIHTASMGRRRIVVGRHDDGALATIPARGQNILIAGGVSSGKSSLAGLLCERWLSQHYTICLFDAEGDYGELEALPGVLLLGADGRLPEVADLVRVMRHADVSVVVDLVRQPLEEKRRFVQSALPALFAMRRESGLPHRVVLDEAHYFLCPGSCAVATAAPDAGLLVISYRVRELDPRVLQSMGTVISTRDSDPESARALRALCDGKGTDEQWAALLAGIPPDGAVLMPSRDDPVREPRPFRASLRQTQHVRHRHKYMDVPIQAGHEFRFTFADGVVGSVARSLQELVDVLGSVTTDRIAPHVRRGDVSRWIREVLRDEVLADTVAGLESRWRMDAAADFNGSLILAVRSRYQVQDDFA